jgi:hypothetical protein
VNDEEKLELLLHAGLDAEAAMRSVPENILSDVICENLADHISNLSCSEKVEDALANINAAIEEIDLAPFNVRRHLGEVRTELRQGLREIGALS